MTRFAPTLTFLVLLLVLPASAAALPIVEATEATDDDSRADLANRVTDACAFEQNAALDAVGTPLAGTAGEWYARCAAPVFAQFLAIPGPLPECQAGGNAPQMDACHHALFGDLVGRVGALAEACASLVPAAPIGCSLADYCPTCPAVPLHASPQRMVLGVELLDIRLDGECSGNVTLHSVPPNEKWTATTGGIQELFHWTITATQNVTDTSSFDFRCEGRPVIEGRAWGGFMRALILTDGDAQMHLCKYDGLTMDGCTGAVNDRDVIGIRGGHDAATGTDLVLPASARFAHEDGWALINLGQGSSRAVQTLDPEPAPVAALHTDHEVMYTMRDLREGDVESASAAGLPWLWCGLLGLLVARRR